MVLFRLPLNWLSGSRTVLEVRANRFKPPGETCKERKIFAVELTTGAITTEWPPIATLWYTWTEQWKFYLLVRQNQSVTREKSSSCENFTLASHDNRTTFRIHITDGRVSVLRRKTIVIIRGRRVSCLKVLSPCGCLKWPASQAKACLVWKARLKLCE